MSGGVAALPRLQSWALPLVVISALTLFLVELQVGKVITAHSGGSPRAWLLLLGCFQLTLVAGYAYAAWWLRRPRAWVHVLLLVLCSAAALGLGAWVGGGPMAAEAIASPMTWVLRSYVAGPAWAIFLCATTVTVVQASLPPQRRARAYALSNAGAFAALLAYPLVLEPFLGLQRSAVLLAVFLLMVACGHGMLARTASHLREQVLPKPSAAACMVLLRMALWAALGCAFLTVATAWATLDLSAMPLLWAALLAAYLLSWVVVMGPLRRVAIAQWDLWAGCALVAIIAVPETGLLHALAMVVGVFLLCSALHARIARSYDGVHHALGNIALALGGALGGMAAAVLPPLLFQATWEWELLLLILAVVLVIDAMVALRSLAGSRLYGALVNRGILVVALLIGIGHGWFIAPGPWTVLAQVRDFHGPWTVSVAADSPRDFRLVSGSTYHGSWGEDASWAYYAPDGPLGAGFAAVRHQRPAQFRCLMVGLGAGTALQYLFAGDEVVVVDISPALLDLHSGSDPVIPALRDSEATLTVRLADGRQVLEEDGQQPFNLIIMDAFTSGAVPAHLLTVEAVARAHSQLAAAGLLLIHTSNRHIRVTDIVMAAAERLGLAAVIVADNPIAERDIRATESTWVAIGDPALLTHPRIIALAREQTGLGDNPSWTEIPIHIPRRQPWTDDRSSVIPYLEW